MLWDNYEHGAARPEGPADAPKILQLHLTWARTDEEADETASRSGRTGVCPSPSRTSATPRTSRRWPSSSGRELQNRVLITPTSTRHTGTIQHYVDIGFDEPVYVHNVGRNQAEFIELFGQEVDPEPAAGLTGAPPAPARRAGMLGEDLRGAPGVVERVVSSGTRRHADDVGLAEVGHDTAASRRGQPARRVRHPQATAGRRARRIARRHESRHPARARRSGATGSQSPDRLPAQRRIPTSSKIASEARIGASDRIGGVEMPPAVGAGPGRTSRPCGNGSPRRCPTSRSSRGSVESRRRGARGRRSGR